MGAGGRAEGPARRLRRLPRREVAGVEVAVATGWRARLLGLSHLDRAAAGPGLLLPRCRCVHGLGLRFELELVFLDARERPLARRRLRRRGLAWHRGAVAVLEIPIPEGGEFSPPGA